MSAFPQAPPSRSAATGASKQVKAGGSSQRSGDGYGARAGEPRRTAVGAPARGWGYRIEVGERRNGRLEVQGDVERIVRSGRAVRQSLALSEDQHPLRR